MLNQFFLILFVFPLLLLEGSMAVNQCGPLPRSTLVPLQIQNTTASWYSNTELDMNNNIYFSFNDSLNYYQYHVASNGKSITLIHSYQCGTDSLGFMKLLPLNQILLVRCDSSIVALSLDGFKPVSEVTITNGLYLIDATEVDNGEILVLLSNSQQNMIIAYNVSNMSKWVLNYYIDSSNSSAFIFSSGNSYFAVCSSSGYFTTVTAYKDGIMLWNLQLPVNCSKQ